MFFFLALRPQVGDADGDTIDRSGHTSVAPSSASASWRHRIGPILPAHDMFGGSRRQRRRAVSNGQKSAEVVSKSFRLREVSCVFHQRSQELEKLRWPNSLEPNRLAGVAQCSWAWFSDRICTGTEEACRGWFYGSLVPTWSTAPDRELPDEISSRGCRISDITTKNHIPKLTTLPFSPRRNRKLSSLKAWNVAICSASAHKVQGDARWDPVDMDGISCECILRLIYDTKLDNPKQGVLKCGALFRESLQ